MLLVQYLQTSPDKSSHYTRMQYDTRLTLLTELYCLAFKHMILEDELLANPFGGCLNFQNFIVAKFQCSKTC